MLEGEGCCGINLEPTYPNIYYLTVFDQSVYLTLAFFGILLSLWPLIKLSWCKSEELVYLHEGQKGLMKVAYAMFVFYMIVFILFAVTFSSPPLPSWMIYRSALFALYGGLHIFLCLLHFYMGMFDRLSGNNVKEERGFSFRKVIILSIIMMGLAVSAFALLLVENKGVSSYDDEDDLKFERRHSVR